MRLIVKTLLTACLALTSITVHAEQLLMARVKQTFPETMLKLQESIKIQGYKLSRVQRVDIGLTKSGYSTDKYRVVFFGKPEEIRHLTDTHPELIPYLPLKVAIYSEGQDTILVAYDPEFLFPHDDRQLSIMFQRWKKDLQAIFQMTAEE